MARYTEYGMAIKKGLIDKDMTQLRFCDEVAKKSGKTFNDSYLSKICRGLPIPAMPEVVTAINEILDLKEG